LIAEEAEPLDVTLNGFHCKVTSQLLTAEPEDDYSVATLDTSPEQV
jgi:hypothetical protein